MGNRKETFANGEYYHICNRGIEGRNIVMEKRDADRFVVCLAEFNTVEPVGSLYLLSFEIKKGKSKKKLVDIVAYCLNPNHFHIILRQKVDGGISEFVKRLSGGHAWYFNKKHKRKGPLFQGHFRAKHITNNNHLLHASVYVNLNDLVHQLSGETAKLVRSSWNQYERKVQGICSPNAIVSQFKTRKDYLEFAKDALAGMIEKRAKYKELKEILLEE